MGHCKEALLYLQSLYHNSVILTALVGSDNLICELMEDEMEGSLLGHRTTQVNL